jgi:hypothetical protein
MGLLYLFAGKIKTNSANNKVKKTACCVGLYGRLK